MGKTERTWRTHHSSLGSRDSKDIGVSGLGFI